MQFLAKIAAEHPKCVFLDMENDKGLKRGADHEAGGWGWGYIPSSGYSRTSTFLIQFLAKMAAGPPILPR